MALPQSLKNDHGSALVEGLVSFGIFSAGAFACLSLTYILIVQTWLIHQSHLGLICIAEGRSHKYCKAKIHQGSQVVLKFGTLKSINFYGDRKSRQEVILKWYIRNHSFTIHQIIDWPMVWSKRAL